MHKVFVLLVPGALLCISTPCAVGQDSAPSIETEISQLKTKLKSVYSVRKTPISGHTVETTTSDIEAASNFAAIPNLHPPAEHLKTTLPPSTTLSANMMKTVFIPKMETSAYVGNYSTLDRTSSWKDRANVGNRLLYKTAEVAVSQKNYKTAIKLLTRIILTGDPEQRLAAMRKRAEIFDLIGDKKLLVLEKKSIVLLESEYPALKK